MASCILLTVVKIRSVRVESLTLISFKVFFVFFHICAPKLVLCILFFYIMFSSCVRNCNVMNVEKKQKVYSPITSIQHFSFLTVHNMDTFLFNPVFPHHFTRRFCSIVTKLCVYLPPFIKVLSWVFLTIYFLSFLCSN